VATCPPASGFACLILFGPRDHAKEMMIVYLPKEKILFQSDLFNPIIPGAEHPVALDAVYHGIASRDTASLLRNIQRLGLKVERVAGSHGRIGTIKELTESVQKVGIRDQ
jgi:flavorubredoxin